jgi:hypothetical protein
MPGPSPTQVKFLSQKYLKNLIRTYHNKRVWEFFKDIKNDPVENKSASPRHQERTACYILPKDGTQTIMTKLIFFDFVMGYQRTNQGFYSEPIYDVHAVRKFRPQIELYFLETRENMEPGYKAISIGENLRKERKSQEIVIKINKYRKALSAVE